MASDFKYDKQSEGALKKLKEIAEFEGYLENAQPEFEALEKKLTHNLANDLDRYAKDIKEIIAHEIVKRYYYQQGSIIQQLKADPEVEEAVKLLNDSVRYTTLFKAPQQKEG